MTTKPHDQEPINRHGNALSRREVLVKGAVSGIAAVALLHTTPLAHASELAAHVSAKSLNVGAKDFTEDQLVAHMYTLLLQQAGFSVTEHFNLPTAIAQAALVKGDIDLYPEYTGTGLEVILKGSAPHTADAYYKAVAAGYEKRFKLTWLAAAPMNDTQGLATTQANSKKYGLKTISDMVKQASKLRFVVNSEFLTRPDGLPGLKRVYGNFSFKSQVVVAGAGSLRYAALEQGRGDVVVAFTTDGLIAGDKLVVLKDDKGYAPPDNLAPVVRDSVLKQNPGIAGILNKLAPKITSAVISDLNYKVDGQHQDLASVAKSFLRQQGLLK